MSDEERQFPLLRNHLDRARLKSVPWGFVAGHERRAQRNHAQSLERLAQRGGLSPKELVALIDDKHWADMGQITDAEANQIIAERLANYTLSALVGAAIGARVGLTHK